MKTFYIVLNWETGGHFCTVKSFEEVRAIAVDGLCYYHVYADTEARAVIVARGSWTYDRSISKSHEVTR